MVKEMTEALIAGLEDKTGAKLNNLYKVMMCLEPNHPYHRRVVLNVDGDLYVVSLCRDKCVPCIAGKVSKEGTEKGTIDDVVLKYNLIDKEEAENVSKKVTLQIGFPYWAFKSKTLEQKI